MASFGSEGGLVFDFLRRPYLDPKSIYLVQMVRRTITGEEMVITMGPLSKSILYSLSFRFVRDFCPVVLVDRFDELPPLARHHTFR